MFSRHVSRELTCQLNVWSAAELLRGGLHNSCMGCFRHCCFGHGYKSSKHQHCDSLRSPAKFGRLLPGEWQSREKWRRCCFHNLRKPVDCPVRKQPATLRDHERITVRRYLENATICRRKWILGYFDVQLNAEASRCCDNCSNNTVVSQD